MFLMNTLRMLADAAFYGTFAGFFAVRCGGSGALGPMVFLCLCFGAASIAGKKRILRLLCLLPSGLGFCLSRASVADCLLLAPVWLYALYLTWQGDYTLSHERQRRVFHAFWRAGAFFVLLTLLTDGLYTAAQGTIPYALAGLCASILLLRSLRHEASVYCQPLYQLVNLATVSLAVGAAFLLGSKAFLNACSAAVSAFYRHLILPVLLVLLELFMLLMRGIGWLLSLFNVTLPENNGAPVFDITGLEENMRDLNAAYEPNASAERVALLLLVVAVIALLFFFFRWLNRREPSSGEAGIPGEKRSILESSVGRAVRKESSPVRSVRAQYQKFLKHSASRGLSLKADTTSLDVEKAVSGLFDQPASDSIRSIYIRARYGDQADQESVRTMRRLVSDFRKHIDHTK